MTQVITTRYQEADTSFIQNRRFVDVVQPGIYQGYFVSINQGANNYILDITSGQDSNSTLVTSEGVVISETSDVRGAVQIDQADPNFTRVDIVVARYKYETTNAASQTYEVIKGQNQTVFASDAVAPNVPDYTIPLAYVTVRGGSTGLVNSDIRPATKASDTQKSEISDLKPTIAIDDRVIYVAPGSFIDNSGTKIVNFKGGYSAPITDETFDNGDTRYYLFGVTDDMQVLPVAYEIEQGDLSQVSTNTYAVAQVRAVKEAGTVRFQTLTDVRVPFARGRGILDEDLQYRNLLSASIFRYLVVENFETTGALTDNTTVNGTAVVDTAAKALRIESTSTSEVSVVTKEIIGSSNIDTIKYFLVEADSTVENLTFDYSVVSPLQGFTGNRYQPGQVINTGIETAARLYLKFYIPADEFIGATFTQIFSYGVLINLDQSSSNSYSITELGLRDLSANAPNLVANGNFYAWSKRDIAGKVPDLSSTSTLQFPISEDNPNAADGWQFTNINHSFSSGAVTRRSQTSSTALGLELEVNNNGTDQAPTVLEYRVAEAKDFVGKKLTMAADYFFNTLNAVSMGIAQLRRTDSGYIVVKTDEVPLGTTAGTIRLITQEQIQSEADVISFYFKFSSTVGIIGNISRVRAAVGAFGDLPYTRHPNAADARSGLVQAGTAYLACTASQGAAVGISNQLGSRLQSQLGEVVAQPANSALANKSSNLGAVDFSVSGNSLIASATATLNGPVTLNADYLVYVKYDGTIS